MIIGYDYSIDNPTTDLTALTPVVLTQCLGCLGEMVSNVTSANNAPKLYCTRKCFILHKNSVAGTHSYRV